MPATSLAFQDDTALMQPGAVRDRLLDQMAATGAKWIRANVIYGKVRTTGGYDFSRFDDLIGEASKRGLRVQLTLMGTPRYVEGVSNRLSYKRPDSHVMGEFAGAAANHFKGRVGRYSIWNEPNYPAFLQAKDPGLAYRRLYQHGYGAIKKVDPKAQVLLGEITSGTGVKNDPHNALAFLRSVIERGNKPLITDGVAFHPYQNGSPLHPVKTPSDYVGISTLDRGQRALAAAAKAGQLTTRMGRAAPMYLTEFGAARTSGSAAQRAMWLQQALRLAQNSGARQLLQYQLSPSSSTSGWDTSIADENGDFGPFLEALRQRLAA